jgi:hypothetical protein
LPVVGRSWRGVVACLALAGGIALADVAAGNDKTQYVGLQVSVPFLAATFTGVVGVLVLGGVAWLAGLTIGLISDDGGTAPQYVRLACLAAPWAWPPWPRAAGSAGSSTCWRAGSGRRRQPRDPAPPPPVLGGVPLAVTYVSASEAARIGGDLYDAVETEHGCAWSSATSAARGSTPCGWPRSPSGRSARRRTGGRPAGRRRGDARRGAPRRRRRGLRHGLLVEVQDGQVRMLAPVTRTRCGCAPAR